MIGKSGRYTEGGTFEKCYRFSIKDLGEGFRKAGHTLGEVVSSLRSGKFESVSGSFAWKRKGRDSNTIDYSIQRDSSGVFLELSYTWYYDGGQEHQERYRYYLAEKESNLKPGTYRYFFEYPSNEGKELFTKLYFYNGIFYPRSVLNRRFGVLYKQQREGHTERYIFSYFGRVPRWEDMKWKKSHYRGKETPVWRRYNYLCKEADTRLLEYFLMKDPALAQEYLQMFHDCKNG